MTWQILLIINLFFASIREFLYKKIADKIDPLVSLFYFYLFSVVWLNLIYIVIHRNIAPFNLNLSLPGLIFVIGFISYFRSLKISLSQSILFQSYSILITVTLAAIFLGELKYFDLASVTGQKVLAGTFLALISFWFLLHTGGKKEVIYQRKWLLYIVITIVALGTGSFFTISYLRSFSPVYILINQNILSVLILIAAIIFMKKSLILKLKMFFLILAGSIVATVSVLAFYGALLLIPVAKLFPIQQVSLVIITMINGIVIFGESHGLTKYRIVGMVLGLVGIVLLVTS